jgi:hypothetical protein
MIKLEQSHVKDVDTFVPQQFLDKINKEIARQFESLRLAGVIQVICERHWPMDAGKELIQIQNTQKTKTHIWYENLCGTCGETIYPHSWVVVNKGEDDE